MKVGSSSVSSWQEVSEAAECEFYSYKGTGGGSTNCRGAACCALRRLLKCRPLPARVKSLVPGLEMPVPCRGGACPRPLSWLCSFMAMLFHAFTRIEIRVFDRAIVYFVDRGLVLLHKYSALSKAQAETWRAQQAAPLQCAIYVTKPRGLSNASLFFVRRILFVRPADTRTFIDPDFQSG